MSGQVTPLVQVGGHFGEWLQGRLGPAGTVALVTVQCPAFHVTATRFAAASLELLQPDEQYLSLPQLSVLLQSLQLPPAGRFVLRGNVPAGGGAGASTAALVAAARAAQSGLTPQVIARACGAAEGATDPLMFDEPDRILWASRIHQVHEALPPPPEFEIVGGFSGPGQRTLAEDLAFPEIGDLVELWQAACARGDRAAVAGIATESARRTTKLRGPQNDPTEEIAQQVGALGYVRAHTGPARGLLFAPGGAPREAETCLRQKGFQNVVRFKTGAGPA